MRRFRLIVLSPSWMREFFSNSGRIMLQCVSLTGLVSSGGRRDKNVHAMSHKSLYHTEFPVDAFSDGLPLTAKNYQVRKGQNR